MNGWSVSLIRLSIIRLALVIGGVRLGKGLALSDLVKEAGFFSRRVLELVEHLAVLKMQQPHQSRHEGHQNKDHSFF